MAYEKQPYNGLNFVTDNDFFEEDDFSSAIDVDPADDSFFAADTEDAFFEDDFNEDAREALLQEISRALSKNKDLVVWLKIDVFLAAFLTLIYVGET